jgi:hypothetical protein
MFIKAGSIGPALVGRKGAGAVSGKAAVDVSQAGSAGALSRFVPSPQPKSDLSDFGRLKAPNSGKPEFGRGEGAHRVCRMLRQGI